MKEFDIPGVSREGIENGITYLSKTGEIQVADFKQYYSDEIVDSKNDILMIQSNIDSLWKAYIDAFENMADGPDKALAIERKSILEQAYNDFNQSAENLISALNAYQEAGQMIVTLEEGDGDTTYVNHRKEELLSQNNYFNDLFYKLDYYISRVDKDLQEEYNVIKSEAKIGNEEVQLQMLNSYNRLLESNIEINKGLIDRLMYIAPIVEHVREDIMKMKVRHADEDVARRKRLLEEKRNKNVLEDVTDYEDLEGQYRHKYNEEGELVATEEGGDGSNRNGIITILVITAIVIAIFVAYVMWGKH